MNGSGGDAVWDEWGRLERFLESTLLAYEREEQSLSSLRGNPLTIRSADNYSMSLDDHLAAVKDKDILFSSVLIHSYAFAESAAADKLHVHLRDLKGIEEWGTSLLESAGSSWERVTGGKVGAVEVAVSRNALAHGTPLLDSQAVRRLERAGSVGDAVGDEIDLHYTRLQRHRNHLKALMKAGGI